MFIIAGTHVKVNVENLISPVSDRLFSEDHVKELADSFERNLNSALYNIAGCQATFGLKNIGI